MRILLSGDSHADINHLKAIEAKINKFDCDIVFILGDYGFWPQDKGGLKFLNACSKLGFPVFFLDGNHECVSSDTRLLTKRGFLYFWEIRSSDKVLSVDDQGKSLWQNIDSLLVKEYKGQMIRVKTRSLEMLLTPGHRVVARKNFGKRSFVEFLAKDWEDQTTKDIVVSGINSNPDFPIEDDLIKLLAWCLSDGSCNSYGRWTIFQRESNKHKITSILDNLSLTYGESKRPPKGEIVIAGKVTSATEPHFDIRISTADSKKLPWEPNKDSLPDWIWQLSDRQIKLFVETFVDGDGSWASQTVSSGVIYCNHKPLREAVVALMAHSGYRTSVTEARPNDIRINFCRSNTVWLNPKYKTIAGELPLSKEEYDGEVWCLEVPNKQFFVERNGSVYLTGNCHDILDKHLEDSIGGFVQVHPNVYWTPRGLVWKWDGITFGAMGGAYSIDRKRRVKYIDWFPQEIISEENVENFDSRVDVLLTHDVPSMVDIITPFILEYNRLIDVDKGTSLNRERLNEIVLKAQPDKLIHGHWHMFYKQDVDTSWGKMQTIGLNCNQSSDWWTILDTEEIKNG